MVDPTTLRTAYAVVREELLAERGAGDHWVGELASSPLATASAISALLLAEQHGRRVSDTFSPEQVYQGDLSELVVHSLHWLARRQNEDGGWGDTDESLSNIATTMVVRAAFQLTGVPVQHAELVEEADAYIERQGGVAGLRRRYGRDRTLAVPVLAHCALAGMIPWRQVPPLPFEMAWFPLAINRLLRLPDIRVAIPALVAVGQARYFHHKPINPLARFMRAAAIEPTLRLVAQMQPPSGGFLEATPLTSLIVMSLASMGRADHAIVRRGVEFLLSSVRPDGSWPLVSDLATWNTSRALAALADGGDESALHDSLDWLLQRQSAGGWSWTTAPDAPPTVHCTASALLALARLRDSNSDATKINAAARDGVQWLLAHQNEDGGWPALCRGWDKLPYDRSAVELTAAALRALHSWRDRFEVSPQIAQATAAGIKYLLSAQQADGSWLPQWAGNQHLPGETSAVVGTASVLLALAELGLLETDSARRGFRWLSDAQQPDGGWGGGPAAIEHDLPQQASTKLETALATEALLAADSSGALQTIADQGLAWLTSAGERRPEHESTPVGWLFGKLWYYERLDPLIGTASALGRAVARLAPYEHAATPDTAGFATASRLSRT